MSRYDTPEKLEAMRRSRRKYDAANREKRNARRSRDAKKRKDAVAAYNERWHAANPGKRKKYSAADYQRNKDRRKAMSLAYRKRKRAETNAARETFTTREEAQRAIDDRGLTGARPRKETGVARFYILRP